MRSFCRTLCAAATALLLLSPGYGQTYTILHYFTGGLDGGEPHQIIQGNDGNFYGTARYGGTYHQGNLFEMDPSGTLNVLYSFTGGVDGSGPQGPVFRDSNGDLYGTTFQGGDPKCRCGTFFKLDTNNVLTVLHTFTTGTAGSYPMNNIVSVNGELYSATLSGGNCCGVLYKITKTGHYTVLQSLTNEGQGSQGDLTRDSAGNIYGETYLGGGGGTIFKLDTAGNFTVLHVFTDTANDGAGPVGRLLRDETTGAITGASQYGAGETHTGLLYRLATDGTVKALHHFFIGPGGYSPWTGLVDVGGTLYGTTVFGGDVSCGYQDSGCGVLFRISKTGVYSVVHTFSGPDGASPVDELTKGSDGSIYGVSKFGGGIGCSSGCGVIFKYTP